MDDLLAQDLDDYEIIVVDDGSCDGSADIIADYASKHDLIHAVMLPENSIGGVATAANAGLELAKGEYIGFADGDDLYAPDMFSKLLNAAQEHGSDLAICDYFLLNDSTGEKTAPADEGRWAELGAAEVVSLDTLGTKKILRFVAVPWRKIYRRELLEKNNISFPVGDYFYEDNPFHWMSVVSAESIALVPEKLCQHRVFREGQTMATTDRRLFKMFEHHNTIYKWLEAHGKLEVFDTSLLRWLVSQTEWISRKCPPELRDELFDTVSPEIKKYSHKQMREMVDENKTGQHGSYLAISLQDGNRKRFHSLVSGHIRFSLLQTAYYRYRRFGAKDVAKEARKLFWKKLKFGLPRIDSPSAIKDAQLERVLSELEDVKVGIRILEQKLDNDSRK
ncbi:hypothetical protein GCM10007094_33730 [Pseudovibrio japonicus]|uniref:Glycosyltransferase 2-like domain-containing protein n=1 Tax=Pseudovibrio japonicus TaxID=366534 RepID=A0ABQ3EM85_9HYPH|nr:hypothetical protein GCM10007094_33730 [Pseudovibrio japonicus]